MSLWMDEITKNIITWTKGTDLNATVISLMIMIARETSGQHFFFFGKLDAYL